jgi:hypothetical protein
MQRQRISGVDPETGKQERGPVDNPQAAIDPANELAKQKRERRGAKRVTGRAAKKATKGSRR